MVNALLEARHGDAQASAEHGKDGRVALGGEERDAVMPRAQTREDCRPRAHSSTASQSRRAAAPTRRGPQQEQALAIGG